MEEKNLKADLALVLRDFPEPIPGRRLSSEEFFGMLSELENFEKKAGLLLEMAGKTGLEFESLLFLTVKCAYEIESANFREGEEEEKEELS